LQFRACGGARVGILSGEGGGLAQSLAAKGPWFEPVLSLGAGARWSRVSLHAGAGAGVPVVRDTFNYEDVLGRLRRAHRPAPVTGRFELGAGVHF
jgi:hypothetical protein